MIASKSIESTRYPIEINEPLRYEIINRSEILECATDCVSLENTFTRICKGRY